MSKRYAALLAVLLSLALAVAAIARSASITVRTSGTILANVVDIKSAHGTLAGEVKDAATGEGAIVFMGVGYGKAQKSTFTAYSTRGSIHGTSVSDNTPNANHTATIANGKVTITGGAGAYRGAKGSGTFSGTQDLNSLRSVIHYKLKYTYKK